MQKVVNMEPHVFKSVCSLRQAPQKRNSEPKNIHQKTFYNTNLLLTALDALMVYIREYNVSRSACTLFYPPKTSFLDHFQVNADLCKYRRGLHGNIDSSGVAKIEEISPERFPIFSS